MPLNTQRNLKQGRLPFTPVEPKIQKKRRLCAEEVTSNSSKVLRTEDGKKVSTTDLLIGTEKLHSTKHHKLDDVEHVLEDGKENLRDAKGSANKTEFSEIVNPRNECNDDESNDSIQFLCIEEKAKPIAKTPISKGKKVKTPFTSGKRKSFKSSDKEKDVKDSDTEKNDGKLSDKEKDVRGSDNVGATNMGKNKNMKGSGKKKVNNAKTRMSKGKKVTKPFISDKEKNAKSSDKEKDIKDSNNKNNFDAKSSDKEKDVQRSDNAKNIDAKSSNKERHLMSSDNVDAESSNNEDMKISDNEKDVVATANGNKKNVRALDKKKVAASANEMYVKALGLGKKNHKRKRSKTQIQTNSIDKMFKSIESKPISASNKTKVYLSCEDKDIFSDDDICEVECDELQNAESPKVSADSKKSVDKELIGSKSNSSTGSSDIDKEPSSSNESLQTTKELASPNESSQTMSRDSKELSSQSSSKQSKDHSIECSSRNSLDTSKSQDDECSLIEETEPNAGDMSQGNCKTPLVRKKVMLTARRRSLTPAQRKKQEERKNEQTRMKLEKEKQKEEREAERQKQKEERLKRKQEELEAKEKEREEKRLKKEEERQKKEVKKEEERLKKEEEKQKKEEERQKKEEERQRKEEEKTKKEEERQRREEEKTLAEEEEKEKQKKLKEKFAQFFVPKKAETCAGQKETENSPGKFILFQIKDNMRMAPLVRSQLSAERREILDSTLKETLSSALCLENYLMCIKKESYLKGKSLQTFPVVENDEDDCEILSEEDDEKIDGTDVLEVSRASGQNKVKRKAKFLQFCENRRPAYFGTWSKPPKNICGRRPFGREEVFDYEYDSDDDWEEIENGESLSDSDGEGDEAGDEEGNNYEVDNDFFVPHGYLSDGEGEEDEEDDGDDEKKGTVENEEPQKKEKLKQKQEEFELEMKQKTKQLKPKVFGCVWLENKNSHQAYEQLLKIMNTHRVMVLSGTCPMNVGCKDSQSQEGKCTDDDDSEESNKKFVKSFPEKAVPALIRLIHGNRNNRAFLTKEFSEYWKKQQSENKDNETANRFRPISLKKIEAKIQEIGQYGRFSEGGIVLKHRTWYVSKDIRKLYDTEDLSFENSWTYSIPPKEWRCDAEKEDKADNKAVDLDDQQSPASQTKSSAGVNLITKFTKVLTDEEEKRKFNFKESESSSPAFARIPKTPGSSDKLSKTIAICKTPGNKTPGSSTKTPGNKTPASLRAFITPSSIDGKIPSENADSSSGTPKSSETSETPKSSAPSDTPKSSAASETLKPSMKSGTPKSGATSETPKSGATSETQKSSAPLNTPKGSASSDTPKSSTPSGTPKTSTPSATPKSSAKGVKKRVNLMKVTKDKVESPNPIAQLFKNVDKAKSDKNSPKIADVKPSEVEECITLD